MAGATEDSPAIDATSVKRHEAFYLQDGVIFLVENVLFKIPRYMLEMNSPFFATLFSLPTASSKTVEGVSDDDPINIARVASLDFERLLAFLYPLTLDYSNFTANWGTPEWESILRLATMWEIVQAREPAIQYLSKSLSPIQKIGYGRLYDHPLWVREGFTNLCLRTNVLSIDEARLLEKDDLWKYSVVREQIRSRLLRPLDRSDGVWTQFRDGSTYVRTGVYEDGAKYRTDPMVKELIEDYWLGRSP